MLRLLKQPLFELVPKGALCLPKQSFLVCSNSRLSKVFSFVSCVFALVCCLVSGTACGVWYGLWCVLWRVVSTIDMLTPLRHGAMA